MVGLKIAVTLAVLGPARGARVAKRSECGAKGGFLTPDDTPSANISIVNGDDADACEWKWQVGLWSGSRGPWCGGTLVAPEWVFSAAHCGCSPDFDIVAGDHNSRDESKWQQRRSAESVYCHPSYNSRTMDNDFSLIKVNSPFELSECVGTACLPTGDDVAPQTECWITGWGTLSSGGSQPRIMQEGKVKVLGNAECKNTGYSSSEILPSMLCAQGKKGGAIVDACQGDSGGPLVCESTPGKYTLYGATSWGYGCAGAQYPGIWSRVHKVVSWANDVMSGNYVPPTQAPCRRRRRYYCY